MSEWQLQTLDSAGIEFIDGDRGKNYPSQDDFLDIGHCLFLSTKNVRANGFDFGDCQFISAEKDELLRKGKLNRGDIVLTTRGTVGNTALYDETVQFEHVRINSGMVIIRMKPTNVDSSFFLYFLRQLDYTSFVSGSAQPQLPIRDLKQIEIALPPLPEQKAIASVLSSLDDKIDLLHRQNKTLEAMAETLFRQWFIEEEKEDWEYVELGSVVETSSGGTPSRKEMSYYENGSIHWVKSKELNGSFITETEEMITDEAVKKSSAKLLPAYSTLIAMYGATVGEYALITKTMTCNQAVCALKENEAYPYTFIFMYVKNQKDELINQAVGSAQQNISQILIKKLPIPTCTARINEYHQLVIPWFKKMQLNVEQIQILEKLRDTLLPKLMSGEVRVQYQTEEVA
ncbi:restriction endonuclease subunit S [Acinetobacter thermotolerans]|uniref:restriction endonuclease subunit S n=1 Tax=Acinetobacter thermotolerans TaxID=3151487 RepID=UPI00325B1350